MTSCPDKEPSDDLTNVCVCLSILQLELVMDTASYLNMPLLYINVNEFSSLATTQPLSLKSINFTADGVVPLLLS